LIRHNDRHKHENPGASTGEGIEGEEEYMEMGMDLSFFYKLAHKLGGGTDSSGMFRSAEWDLMNLTSARHAVLYTSCCGPETYTLALLFLPNQFASSYVDITYYLELRRKTLFFTCNLIIPCFLISFLTTVLSKPSKPSNLFPSPQFVFYLSDHKITFSISILVTLTVFFLVLIDLMPPTSLEVPMFGQYLVTTMASPPPLKP
jgi:nicotinic acetylcholine receptor